MSFPHCAIGKNVTLAGLELLHPHGPLKRGVTTRCHVVVTRTVNSIQCVSGGGII